MYKNQNIKFSVMMNCFNGEKYLEEAIKSVLNQTYQNWELIFWDNQSSDNSAKIFKTFKDKRLKYYLSYVHTGLGQARKNAFQKTEGELIAILDVDDVWLPDKLQKQVYCFKDPEVGIVISNVNYFNKKKKKKKFTTVPPSGYVFEDLLSEYYIVESSQVLKRSYIDMLSYHYDPEFNYIPDFDLVLRMSKICKLFVIDEVLAEWRIQSSSESFKSPEKFSSEIKKWIDKQILNNVIEKNKNKIAIQNLINRNNRQIAIFELINGNRKRYLKFFVSEKNKTLKDLLILFMAFFPFSSIFIKYFYLKRISKGLLE